MSGPAWAQRSVVVTIDGPAASGKSSTAKAVAERLDFIHADSGALYRAITAARIHAGGEGGAWTESSVLESITRVGMAKRGPSFIPTLDGRVSDEEEVAEELRGPAVTRHVSIVAKMPAVRERINAALRALARDSTVVLDGRDMGTVAFPDADVKVFLTADAWERARRRVLQREGREATDGEIAEETERLVKRDALDAEQTVPASDAVIIDTTNLTQNEQVERIVALVQATING